MRTKVRLISICIRHKCYDAREMESIFNKPFIKRKVSINTKKLKDFDQANKYLTSTDVPKQTDNFNLTINSCNNNEIFSSLSRTQEDQSINDVSVKCESKVNILNVPEIPNNFEQSFFKSFKPCNKASHNDNNNVTEQYNVTSPNSKIQNVKLEELKGKNNTESPKNPQTIRFNEINMQMLSKSLYDQLFRNQNQDVLLPEETVEEIKENLRKYEIKTEDVTILPNVDIELPPLEGKDLEEHFYNIAKKQIEPYMKIIDKIMADVPPMPEKWLLKEGWTRYTTDAVESVDYPLECGMVFDVEVCMKEGPLPTLATAVTDKAWYGWVSPVLIQDSSFKFHDNYFTMDMLIPTESTKEESGTRLNSLHKKPKIIIGHNVSFDRAKIKEQYWLNCTGTRFVDTMSLHICVSGINSYQRSILRSEKQKGIEDNWQNYTSLNSLKEVYKLYCGEEIDKHSRDVFIEGSLVDIRNQFNDLMSYCASDVVATHGVFQKLFPIFQERFPHPVTFSGMLELGSAYLPVNSNWQRYIEEAESTFEDVNYESKLILAKRANEVCKLMHGEKYKEDLWMWDQDWSTQQIKMKSSLSKAKQEEIKNAENQKNTSDRKVDRAYLTDDEEEEEDPLEKEFGHLEATRHLLPTKLPHMPGYPAWYRKLCSKSIDEDWILGPQNISTSMQITPKILNLTWENYPLHYIKQHGWGILVPYNSDPDIDTKIPLKQLLKQCPLPESNNRRDASDNAMLTISSEVEKDLHKVECWRYKKEKKDQYYKNVYKGTAIWCDIELDNCCYFFKLPHKDGANYNVGNPLAKDFLNKFSDNVLAGSDESASKILKSARTVSYWRNNRDRIMSQFVVWFEKDQLSSGMRKSGDKMKYGAIIPQVIVSGTLTRRAVEPTWMTASNAHIERIGSELRSMVQAPPGYKIVGADVDSQELWIASIIGDAHFKKVHGATPFGWMTLIGNKSNGTDMHSVTARAVGISRDHAKVINYARIYGAGQKFAERLLKQFNPSMTESEAASKSRKMFALTKGKKVYKLKAEFINEDLVDTNYTAGQAFTLAKMYGKSLGEMFEKSEWLNGSESAMFNKLEEVAQSSTPVTPFLNCRLSRALENRGGEEKYLPTKVNWVVQSGAVDYLHLMLVCMKWLMRNNVRFCLSFHDEVRYLVPSRYKYNAALAMHVTNLMTRSFCALRLGMKDLPMSVAFFTAVEVDTTLRKDSNQDCRTPSNPHGLENGYGIPLGESLNVWEALEKSEGSLGSWRKDSKA